MNASIGHASIDRASIDRASIDGIAPMSHGVGSVLYDASGAAWTDLVSGFGAVFLGHAHAATVDAMHAQADRLWTCGRLPVVGDGEFDRLLRAVLPAGMQPGGLMSTGMEAAEFAIRVAATHTGRSAFIGLARSMHGKSAMTAAMCWQNAPLRPSDLHMLPFADALDEPALLARIETLLATRRIAALLVEPVQGSNGAHAVSLGFCDEAAALCRRYDSLLVMDEILTGLYRTGPSFVSARMVVPPDLMLFAKSMGNGFPVSSLARAAHVRILPEALPGSTFAGNPMALAVATATLASMGALPLTAMVAGIEAVVKAHLGTLADEGLRLRGSGALWCVEMDRGFDPAIVQRALRASGVLASVTGRSVRLLPAATIPSALLHDACARIVDALRSARTAS